MEVHREDLKEGYTRKQLSWIARPGLEEQEMDKIEEFVDERQKSWCIQCGAWIGDVDTSDDHVPSKGLLRKPYPENLPVVNICNTCNNSFSADEEYLLLFLHCVLAGATDPDHQTEAKISRALKRHEKLRARIERSKTEYQTIGGETRYVWKPETERINRIIIKNARGHAFYECGEPMLIEPAKVRAIPLESMTAAERGEFEHILTDGKIAGWPEVGSRMMTRVMTGQDLCDGWVVVQEGIYRYCVAQCDVIRVRSIIYEYLATEVYWSDC